MVILAAFLLVSANAWMAPTPAPNPPPVPVAAAARPAAVKLKAYPAPFFANCLALSDLVGSGGGTPLKGA